MQSFHAKRSQYVIKINSRKLVDSYMQDQLGLNDVQAQTLGKLIDRMNKMPYAEFAAGVDAVFSPSQRKSGLAAQLFDALSIKDIQALPEEIYTHSSASELKTLIHQLN